MRTAEETGSYKHARVQTNEVKNVPGDLEEVHVQKNLSCVVGTVHPVANQQASDDSRDAVRWQLNNQNEISSRQISSA